MQKLTNKLSLNKKTLVSLDDRKMASVKGGFTYSLSTGEVCRHSRIHSSSSAYECGVDHALEAMN
jgi:natural product precursor